MDRLTTQASELSLLERFHDVAARGLGEWEPPGGLDAVVGVPFRGDDDTLPAVVRTAWRGLEAAGLGERAAVLVVGAHTGARTLDRLAELRREVGAARLHGFLLDPDFDAPGWCARALMTAASDARVALVLLRPDLVPRPASDPTPTRGFSPRWIPRLLDPVRNHGQDLALARFNRHPLEHAVESLLAGPVIAGAFGIRLRQPMPGVCAMSPRMIRKCLAAREGWPVGTVALGGASLWLTLRALAEECALCEVPLGLAFFDHEAGRLATAFHQAAHTLVQQVCLEGRWRRPPAPTRAATVCGADPDELPQPVRLDPADLLRNLRLEFDRLSGTLLSRVVAPELLDRLRARLDRAPAGVALDDAEWASAIRDFLGAACVDRTFDTSDLADGLYPFFLARLLGLVTEAHALEASLRMAPGLAADTARALLIGHHDRGARRLEDEVITVWPRLAEASQLREQAIGAPRAGVCGLELVPNVVVMVPGELRRPDGRTVTAAEAAGDLAQRHRDAALAFLAADLGVDEPADSGRVLRTVAEFMRALERALDETLFPGDLSTVDGARALLAELLDRFNPGETLQLTEAAALALIRRVPPQNLATHLGVTNLGGLLSRVGPLDALAMAAWTDRHRYLDRVLDLIGNEARPDWFHLGPVRTVALDPKRLANVDDVHGTGVLPKLAGRVIAGSHSRSWGGELPKLWFVLRAFKRFASIELTSRVWLAIVEDRAAVGERLARSIRGGWGRGPLSAYNVFENIQQDLVAQRLSAVAESLSAEGGARGQAARLLSTAARAYHMSFALGDGAFVPLSAWTWASFSHRGGVGVPTPLSSLVERDRASRDVLARCLAAVGRDEAAVERAVLELVAEGRASEDLGEHLLGKASGWNARSTLLPVPV
jgi:hypothetical protein